MNSIEHNKKMMFNATKTGDLRLINEEDFQHFTETSIDDYVDDGNANY